MRSYFEVLRTLQEDRSMIMGTNIEPGVRSFIELQAVTAGYERIDLIEWLKVTPVRTLEDLLIAQYQDKHVALKARLKLEALKGQTWRTSMQVLEQYLTGLFTTPNVGWTDVSCMDVVMGVAPKEYASRLGLKDHTTWQELLTDLVNLEAKDLARRAKAPPVGRTSQRKNHWVYSDQPSMHCFAVWLAGEVRGRMASADLLGRAGREGGRHGRRHPSLINSSRGTYGHLRNSLATSNRHLSVASSRSNGSGGRSSAAPGAGPGLLGASPSGYGANGNYGQRGNDFSSYGSRSSGRYRGGGGGGGSGASMASVNGGLNPGGRLVGNEGSRVAIGFDMGVDMGYRDPAFGAGELRDYGHGTRGGGILPSPDGSEYTPHGTFIRTPRAASRFAGQRNQAGRRGSHRIPAVYPHDVHRRSNGSQGVSFEGGARTDMRMPFLYVDHAGVPVGSVLGEVAESDTSSGFHSSWAYVDSSPSFSSSGVIPFLLHDEAHEMELPRSSSRPLHEDSNWGSIGSGPVGRWLGHEDQGYMSEETREVTRSRRLTGTRGPFHRTVRLPNLRQRTATFILLTFVRLLGVVVPQLCRAVLVISATIC
ncbi:hypothetical protein CBR_g16134 [Chara braunii]|uniref:Uncharacterized protein n=1 Tax=Chara braunii TaxID=69332 RepID=A0A388KTV0_CHABU|nr:hypothetical protein CBR_g16134 [Chara braunii]|eukprot:GBG73418.1 hypothetical protein CBR_g16134 [Chara braunii]